MPMYDCVYEGQRYPVHASNHLAARSLGTRHIANVLGCIVPSKVAVVDLELAAGYKPARYMNITEGLRYTVDISDKGDAMRAALEAKLDDHTPVPAEVQRVAYGLMHDELLAKQVELGKVHERANHLCVCVAGPGDHCTCKSWDRAQWQITSEAFDLKLANAHLDGFGDGR